jgi:transposase
MAKIEKICGIDISKRKFDASIEEGEKIRSRQFDNNEEGMKNFMKFITPETVCVMESTGTYHCALAYFLHEKGISVILANPLSVKRYAQSLMLRTKSDKADSKMLILYGKNFDLKLWQPKEARYIELHQLINHQSSLCHQEGAVRNQLEALNHSVVQSELVKEKLIMRMRDIKEEMKIIEKEMNRIINEGNKEDYKRLKEIPGIGKKTAIVLIALTQCFRDFENAKEVCSYFGLCPRVYTSGSSVKGKGHICKMGMSMIRKLLYMCALSAMKYNAACRELYERLVKNGKPKKLALIAVANKLVKQSFAIIKNGTSYDENFFENKFAC